MARTIALLTALAGAILWVILAATPPAPLGVDAPPTAFSAARAFPDIEAISRAPHPTASPENARVRAYLVERLKTLGAEVSEQPVAIPADVHTHVTRWNDGKNIGFVGSNVIGVIPGKDRTKPALLLMAHHDTVGGSPGAADDSMGIAAALETARALKAQGQGKRDLILLFTDSEELGLLGSVAFFNQHPLAKRTGMIINLEARGSAGRANMFETGSGNGAQMQLYADTVARPAANSLSVLMYDVMPNTSDYTIPKKLGIAGYNLAIVDRAFTYHSPTSTPDMLDRGSVQDMGDQALALSSAMLFADELPVRTDNAAFADLLGRVTIVYPPVAGWAILLVAGLLIGLSIACTRPSPRQIGGGMVVLAALLLHGALLLTVLNVFSGAVGSNYYDRLAALPRLEIIAGLAAVALLALLALFLRPTPRMFSIAPAMALMLAGLFAGGPPAMLLGIAVLAMAAAWFLPASQDDRGIGATLLLFVAAILLQALLPTAGPLFAWPLLMAALALAARTTLPPTPGLAVATICAVIGVGHLGTQAYFMFLGVGAEMPVTLILPLFAALPLILPLMPDRTPRWMPAAALTVALLMALWVRLDPMAPSVPGYSLDQGDDKTKD